MGCARCSRRGRPDPGGAAADGPRRAWRHPRRDRPDVVLMDIRMPGWTVWPRCARSHGGPGAERRPGTIMLTTFELDEYVFAALRGGPSGFVLKDAEPTNWCGRSASWPPGSLLSPSVTRRVIEQFAGPSTAPAAPTPSSRELTEREREIVAWVATGRSNDEIAAELV